MKIGYLCALLVGGTACGDVLDTSDATLTASSAGVDSSGVGSGSCVDDRPMHGFASSDDVRARLLGTWRMCTGAKVALSPRDAEGFVVTQTAIQFLFPRDDGGLGAADDTSTVGTWGVEDDDPENVRFVFGISARTFDAQTSEDGWILNLDDASRGIRSTFVRVK